MSEPGPNAEAIEVWNDIVGPKFIRHKHVLTTGFARHGEAALELYPVAPGQRVLDMGCGFGDTAALLARAVGPDGKVVAYDCTTSFLDIAREENRGIANIEYRLGDAQTDAFTPEFDRIFSRFGTMFFQSAVSAMRNLRRALVPGGLLTMVVWRARAVNDWVEETRSVVLRHVPEPPAGPTCGPGPFSMADPETVTQQLFAAGYRDLRFHPIEVDVVMGATPDDAIGVALDLGPAGELMRLAGETGERARPDIVRDLRELFAGHVRDGGVTMRSKAWVVAARAS